MDYYPAIGYGGDAIGDTSDWDRMAISNPPRTGGRTNTHKKAEGDLWRRGAIIGRGCTGEFSRAKAKKVLVPRTQEK